MSLKILSYNIQSGHNADYASACHETAEYIGKVGADIVGLNEVDFRNSRNSNMDMTDFIRNRAGLYPYCAFCPSIDFRGGYYGNALLSKYPIVEREFVAIPAAPDADKRHEPRSILRCVIDTPEGKVTVMVTHYGVTAPSERVEGVKKTIELAEKAGMPVIFMGDLNAVPTAPELAPLYTALVDTAAGFDEAELMSIDSKNPRKRIDYIFTNNMLKTVSVEVPKVLYSDHCPYIALLEKAQ